MEGPDNQGASTPLPTKADIYADAIIVALAETADTIGGPDINAALSALTFSQAYLIAKIDNREDRRRCLKECEDALRQRTGQMVNDRLIREGKV